VRTSVVPAWQVCLLTKQEVLHVMCVTQVNFPHSLVSLRVQIAQLVTLPIPLRLRSVVHVALVCFKMIQKRQILSLASRVRLGAYLTKTAQHARNHHGLPLQTAKVLVLVRQNTLMEEAQTKRTGPAKLVLSVLTVKPSKRLLH
jgi:hypothetical protein